MQFESKMAVRDDVTTHLLEDGVEQLLVVVEVDELASVVELVVVVLFLVVEHVTLDQQRLLLRITKAIENIEQVETNELVSNDCPLHDVIAGENEAVDECEHGRLVRVGAVTAQFEQKETEAVALLLQTLKNTKTS